MRIIGAAAAAAAAAAILLLGDKITETPASDVPVVGYVEVLEGVAVAADREHHFVVNDWQLSEIERGNGEKIR